MNISRATVAIPLVMYILIGTAYVIITETPPSESALLLGVTAFLGFFAGSCAILLESPPYSKNRWEKLDLGISAAIGMILGVIAFAQIDNRLIIGVLEITAHTEVETTDGGIGAAIIGLVIVGGIAGVGAVVAGSFREKISIIPLGTPSKSASKAARTNDKLDSSPTATNNAGRETEVTSDNYTQEVPDKALSPSLALSRISKVRGDALDAIENKAKINTDPVQGKKERAEFLVRKEKTTYEYDKKRESETADLSYAEIDGGPPSGFEEVEYSAITDQHKTHCKECGGDGRVCYECNGAGEVACNNSDCYDGMIETDCDKCGGSGDYRVKVGDSKERRKCKECNRHNRKQRGPCPSCNGQPPKGKQGVMLCPTCDGDLDAHSCNYCRGKGEVIAKKHKKVIYEIDAKEVTETDLDRYFDSEIGWEEVSGKIVDNTTEVPVKIPDNKDIIDIRVSEHWPVAYNAEVSLGSDSFEMLVSDDEVLTTTGKPKAKKQGIRATALTSLFGGALLGLILSLVLDLLIGFPSSQVGIWLIYVTVFGPVVILFAYFMFVNRLYEYEVEEQ